MAAKVTIFMSSPFSQFGLAVSAYGRSFHYLFKKGYRGYLFLPVIINLVFLATVISLSVLYSRHLLQYLFGLFGYNLEALAGEWSTALVILIQILQFLLFLIFYKYLVLIVLAPFLAFLSEKLEKEKLGQDYPFSWSQFLADIVRALLINLWNFLREIFFTLLLSLLFFIPLLAPIIPILILVMQSYFYGYGLMDYNAERWRLGFKDTERWMWRHKGAVVGSGLIFHFLFLVPLLGWIFAPVWAVMASTLAAIELNSASTAGGHTLNKL